MDTENIIVLHDMRTGDPVPLFKDEQFSAVHTSRKVVLRTERGNYIHISVEEYADKVRDL